MKQLLIAVLGLLILLPIHSQEDVNYYEKKNVINIGNFNAFELNKMPDFGIGYKRIISKGAVRSSVGWNTEYIENSIYGGGYTQSNDGNITFRVGYEHHENYNRLQLYYGGDLAYNYSESTVKYLDVDGYYARVQFTQANRLSVRPTLGLTVFLIPFNVGVDHYHLPVKNTTTTIQL